MEDVVKYRVLNGIYQGQRWCLLRDRWRNKLDLLKFLRLFLYPVLQILLDILDFRYYFESLQLKSLLPWEKRECR